MSGQPESMRYADECDSGHPLEEDAKHAATLLRAQHARIAELEAERETLRVVLADLESEFRKVFPIYYYAEPWAHNTNASLLRAQAVLSPTKERR